MELYVANRDDWRKWLEDDSLPGDQAAVYNNIKAYDNFLKFCPSARRLYIGWLNSAVKKETWSKRIEKIIARAENNLPPGMM